MFEVTIHIPALDRLADTLIAISAGEGAAKAKPAPAKDRPAPKATSKPAPKDEPVEDPSDNADGIDYDALRALATEKLKQINKANGVEAVREALGELGVKNIGAVADEDLQAAIDLFDSKLA